MVLTLIPYYIHADWSEVEPLEYLNPFLQVIKSPETSGTVTDVALMAVLKILQSNMLGKVYALFFYYLTLIVCASTLCLYH